MTIKRTASMLRAGLLALSAPLFGQDVNTLSAQERAQRVKGLFGAPR